MFGCSAIIIVGNSLLPGEQEVWYTPFYYLNATKFKHRRKDSAIETQSTITMTEENTGQLCLSL